MAGVAIGFYSKLVGIENERSDFRLILAGTDIAIGG